MSTNNTNNTTAVAIFEPQNVQTIVQIGPDAFHRNVSSHDACLRAGQELLERVRIEGMTDELDDLVAKYIVKTKVTLKNMNDRRSPVTQLFDQVRKAYTTLENNIDPTKGGTVAYQLQAARNAYAAKKLEEAERARREEAARQALQQARERYRLDVAEDYRRQFNAIIVSKINELVLLDRAVTLDNFDELQHKIESFPAQVSDNFVSGITSGVLLPTGINVNESRKIQASVLAEILDMFKEQYTAEVGGARQEILDRLPSKRTELQRIARACAEEAARIKAELQAREAEETARQEQERAERERRQKAAAELAAQKSEMDSLFNTSAVQACETKASVKKRVCIRSAQDIMNVVAFWWSQEGCELPLDELVKIFKKQITFAEKAANGANPVFINAVDYTDEVKAK